MSPWILAEDWLSVAGLLMLVVGTGAQARDELDKYRDLLRRLPREVVSAFASNFLTAASVSILTARSGSAWRTYARLFWMIPVAIFLVPAQLTKPREEGGTDVDRLFRLAHSAAVWTVLMTGSLLILAAAVIQFALA